MSDTLADRAARWLIAQHADIGQGVGSVQPIMIAEEMDLDPGQFEKLKEMEKSTRKGFGTVVSLLPGRVIVLQTMPGSPSAFLRAARSSRASTA